MAEAPEVDATAATVQITWCDWTQTKADSMCERAHGEGPYHREVTVPTNCTYEEARAIADGVTACPTCDGKGWVKHDVAAALVGRAGSGPSREGRDG